MAIASINPFTGQLLKTFEPLSDAQIDEKLQRASEAFSKYRRLSFAERAPMMSKAADILEGEKDAFGRLMTTEMGKPFRAAVDEAAKCAWACRHYAEHGQRLLADEVVQTTASRSYIHYQPLGPILAVCRGTSLLAGISVRGAGPDGGQCGAAENRPILAKIRSTARRRQILLPAGAKPFAAKKSAPCPVDVIRNVVRAGQRLAQRGQLPTSLGVHRLTCV